MSTGKENDEEYKLMLRLEHLESLREEMLEVGVRSIEDIDAEIAKLHRRLDDMDKGNPD